MADELIIQERKKYAQMWNFESYRERSPGMRFLNDALNHLQMPPASTVLDIGCGTGRVSSSLAGMGFSVTAVDIAENSCTEFDGPFVEACVWDLPADLGQFNYGVCFDVMEHIPTERVAQTLESVSQHVGTCYFQIANFVCHEGDKIGEHLHLTVKPIHWWATVMKPWFDVQFSIARPKHHIFVCKSRQF